MHTSFLVLTGIFVSDVPTGPPVIADAETAFFKIGDWLNLNCTSRPSRPPTRLTWLVNGIEVIYHFILHSLLLHRSIMYRSTVIPLGFWGAG